MRYKIPQKEIEIKFYTVFSNQLISTEHLGNPPLKLVVEENQTLKYSIESPTPLDMRPRNPITPSLYHSTTTSKSRHLDHTRTLHSISPMIRTTLHQSKLFVGLLETPTASSDTNWETTLRS